MSIQHFPVIAVMGLFLGAFLTQIVSGINRVLRNAVAMFFSTGAFVLMLLLIKPVLIDGQIITYWMGSWEPVNGYAIGIGYEVDRLSLFFALLVSLSFWLSGLYSWRYIEREKHLGYYYTLYLMLSGGVLGLVLTGDVFNMFVMIEIMTFAAVALATFRNYKEGALEAAFKYLTIGSVGSSCTLLGVTLLYMQCHTLNMAELSARLASQGLTPTTVLAFGLMFTGFCVKSFVVPFHTPAADAYQTAPTSISMIFSGMVNKAGVYGMIRLAFVIFRAMDNSAIQVIMVVIGAVTMFVGVTMALAQHNFKRLLAFHSISQIGYVFMAIGLSTTLGLPGGLYHAMNHTLFKGLLFLTAGCVCYSAGAVDLDNLGGMAKKMPESTVCFLIGALSISGIPPFNGFASKWMIYQAAYEKAVITGHFGYLLCTVLAVVVSVMTLASFIKVTHAVFFGRPHKEIADRNEVPIGMRIPMWIMAALCVLSGLFYDFVNEHILAPVVNAVTNVATYVDTMMGAGTAAAAGIADKPVEAVTFSYWDPILWLVLFVIVLVAFCIVLVTGKSDRGKTLVTSEPDIAAIEDGKFGTFFGGEHAMHSRVYGSDMFWGFKKNWAKYFRFMEKVHSGNVNDYATYAVSAAAVLIVCIFIFVR